MNILDMLYIDGTEKTNTEVWPKKFGNKKKKLPHSFYFSSTLSLLLLISCLFGSLVFRSRSIFILIIFYLRA